MAVGADGPEVLLGIHNVFSPYGGELAEVMDMDEPLPYWAIGAFEIKAAN